MGPSTTTYLLTAAAALALTAATTAPAVTVDNPQYGLWSKFRPGSSVTMAGDVDAGTMGKLHLEVTQTLTSVTPDAATVSSATQVTMGGQPRPGGPPSVQTIPAKAAQADMTQTGTADVQAMGKPFPCKVYAVSHGAGAPKGTAYVNDAVPGGVVKLVLTGANGKTLTFTLAADDVK